ncbi:hypothetical protein [Rothia mucilaginosa]|uniref:hypothetical protein n=1 Tax=Rothia mucilaginosa TaxID=43675 RepID=UPI0028F10186|nr:hypothetical protein [Rothia mucilaginosa]
MSMTLVFVLGPFVMGAIFLVIWMVVDAVETKMLRKELKQRNEKYRRAHQETVVVEPVNQILKIDTNFYTYNEYLRRNEIKHGTTFEDVQHRKPLVRLYSMVEGSKDGYETTLHYHQEEDYWTVSGWDGDPTALKARSRSVVYVVPSDQGYSYTTVEYWHYYLCRKSRLEEEGAAHDHERCARSNSVKHITWHIKQN